MNHVSGNKMALLNVNIIELSIESNGRGVLSLVADHEGSLKVAFGRFKESLNAIDGMCRMIDENGDNSLPLISWPSLIGNVTFCCTALAVPGLCDQRFYIFNHAIVYALEGCALHTPLAEPSSIMPYMPYCGAVSPFNIGICYHQLALKRGENEILLQKARILYSKSIEMANAMPSVKVGDDMFMLQLVAHNNGAQIEYSLMDSEAMQRSVSCASDMMQALLSTGWTDKESNKSKSFLLAEQLDEIALNLTAGMITTHTSAPTA
jgi:hypothetical protein